MIELFEKAKKFFEKHDTRFPKEVKGYWYCGEWYLHLSDLHDKGLYDMKRMNSDPAIVETPARDKVCFNHCRCGFTTFGDSSELIDGLIPAIRVDDKIGLYKQVGRQYCENNFYDGAPWDNGMKIDLEFVRTVEIKTLTKG